MKYIYTILLIAFVGCKKSDTTIALTSIQGKWEIRAAQAGMTPGNTFTAGNGHYLVFAGNTYKEIEAGVQVGSGTFEVRSDPRPSNVCLSGIPVEAKAQLFWTPARGGVIPYFLFEGNRVKFYAGCSALDSGVYSEWEKVN